MYVDTSTIITMASVLTAIGVIGSLLFKLYRWYEKQNKQDVEISKIKSEQCLIVYGLLACLKGLKEQGCNGPVTEAINKLEKHINQTAHE